MVRRVVTSVGETSNGMEVSIFKKGKSSSKLENNFDRAIKSSQESQDFTTFHQGIEMIEKQFVSMLERNWGLKRFEGAGEGFDPEKHEALFMEEAVDVESPTVVEDYQKGYILHDRVLRPAKVKVLMPVSESEADDAGAEEITSETNQENGK